MKSVYINRRPKRSRSHFIAAVLIAVLPLAAILQGIWISKNKEKFRPIVLRFYIDRFECSNCDGVGTLRDPDHPDKVVLCPVCFGVGGHQVRRFDPTNEVMCPACTGMGWIPDKTGFSARLCKRCGGRGLISAEQGAESD